MRVAIIGCGPAGLLTALAAQQCGHSVDIFSVKAKSVISGAQYIHEMPPGMELVPAGYVYTFCNGTAAVYSRKVYGTEAYAAGWELRNGLRQAWSLRELYDKLWQRFQRDIIDDRMDYVGATVLTSSSYEKVFNSAPAHALCHERSGHRFDRQNIVLYPVLPHWVEHGPEFLAHPNVVMYSGRRTDPWNRASRLWGHTWTEFSNHGGHIPGGERAVRGFKPMGHNCDCHPTIISVGRFGEWQRGILTHHAYEKAMETLK